MLGLLCFSFSGFVSCLTGVWSALGFGVGEEGGGGGVEVKVDGSFEKSFARDGQLMCEEAVCYLTM